MNNFFNIKNFYFLLALLSICTLISAVYIEYAIGIKPCKLCLYQRLPYIVSIFLCFFGYINSKNPIWIGLLSLTFLVSIILSGYHWGIESNIFPEFSGCTANNLNILDKEELLNSLSEILPNCKDVSFRIFGLSLATINFFISLLIVLISLVVIKNEKNR
tara:strand:- start:1061 stop:1540 length:480 start_codon:yes stop_codon:yes gene_type:complete